MNRNTNCRPKCFFCQALACSAGRLRSSMVGMVGVRDGRDGRDGRNGGVRGGRLWWACVVGVVGIIRTCPAPPLMHPRFLPHLTNSHEPRITRDGERRCPLPLLLLKWIQLELSCVLRCGSTHADLRGTSSIPTTIRAHTYAVSPSCHLAILPA